MILEKGPRGNGPSPLLRQRGKAWDEGGPINVIPKDDAPLQAPHHHLVEGVGRIETGLPWHDEGYGSASLQRMQRIMPRRLVPAFDTAQIRSSSDDI